MNRKEFNVSVSTRENAAKVINGVIQYDTGNLFNINILEGAYPFDFTGYSNVIIEVLKPDGTVFVDGDGGSLDVLDAEEGLVAFGLQPQCVLLKGMHFITISIYSNGVKVTTARLNYYVSESMDDSQGDDVISMSEYPVMQLLLAQASNIIEAEQMRVIAEQLRQQAEADRVSGTSGVLAQVQKAIEQMQSYVGSVKDWYDLFMSAAGDASGVDLSTVVTQTNLFDVLKDIDCGEFTGTANKTLHIQGGEEEHLPALEDRELGYVRGKQALYIGDNGVNVCLNPSCYVVQPTAPADTTVLWVDASNGGAIKYWDGANWVGTAKATFA